MDESYTRREFLGKTARMTGAVMLAGSAAGQPVAASQPGTLPQRRLGRTGVPVSVLGIGLAPLGMANYPPEEFRAVVQAALDEGVNYFDVQPNYGEAESYLAPLLWQHRERLFLVTKTWEQDKEGVLESVAGSLRRLGVASVDAVLLNNIGDYDLSRLSRPDGALAGLKEAQRRGQVRFFGLSGHIRPEHFEQALKTGEFDMVMAPFNFVDRHIYEFEQRILPAAARHSAGVVAMKVLGGAAGLKYDTREQKAMLLDSDYQPAMRYALGLPHMCAAVIGCKSAAEVRQAARVAREYRALSPRELGSVLARGKELAQQWGKRYPGS